MHSSGQIASSVLQMFLQIWVCLEMYWSLLQTWGQTEQTRCARVQDVPAGVWSEAALGHGSFPAAALGHGWDTWGAPTALPRLSLLLLSALHTSLLCFRTAVYDDLTL